MSKHKYAYTPKKVTVTIGGKFFSSSCCYCAKELKETDNHCSKCLERAHLESGQPLRLCRTQFCGAPYVADRDTLHCEACSSSPGFREPTHTRLCLDCRNWFEPKYKHCPSCAVRAERFEVYGK